MRFSTLSRSLGLSSLLVLVCLYGLFHTSWHTLSSIIPAGLSHGDGTPTTATNPVNPSLNGESKPNVVSPQDVGLPTRHRTSQEDRPLIVYAYYESEFARVNLRFFVDHALHDAADFLFIMNGETDADQKIVFAPQDIPDDLRDVLPERSRKNVFVKKRGNTCFDLGAHAEVLNSEMGVGDGWIGQDGPIVADHDKNKDKKMLLRNRYKRFILMNASIRGPFVPRWSRECWSDAYLSRLTDKIKLVGMSYNCHAGKGHIQSMIWATDRIGLDIILKPEAVGICFAEMIQAMEAEVRTTQVLRDAGYEVDVFLSVYHSENKYAKWDRMRAKKLAGIEQFRKRDEIAASVEADGSAAPQDGQKPEEKAKPAEVPREESAQQTKEDAERHRKEEEEKRQRKAKEDKLLLVHDNEMPGYFWRECMYEDWLKPAGYYRTFVHPYENLFMKSHREIEDNVLERLTEWHDGWGYESYDVCF